MPLICVKCFTELLILIFTLAQQGRFPVGLEPSPSLELMLLPNCQGNTGPLDQNSELKEQENHFHKITCMYDCFLA